MHWDTLVPYFERLAEATTASSSVAALVSTVDTARSQYFLDVLSRRAERPVMLVGDRGSAKSLVAQQYLSTRTTGDHEHLSRTIVFSSATTSTMLQVRVRMS